jgi:hypothetical protein
LGDSGDVIGNGAPPADGMCRRFVEHTELETHLAQRTDASVEHATVVRSHGWGHVELSSDGVEDLLAEIVEANTAGHAHERQRRLAHLVQPAVGPS